MQQQPFKLIDQYYTIWAFLVPITSVVVFPSVQGTTPGYLMCFLSFSIVMLYGGSGRVRYSRFLAAAAILWLMLFSLSQLADLTSTYIPDITMLPLVNPFDAQFVMRSTLFTQSLYVVAVVMYGAYLYIYYDDAWDRIIVAAGVAFALYGLYECVYYLITGHAGDFLSNREFGDALGNAKVSGDTVNGSAFQTFDVAGISLQRMKALTGEPSMYALSMFPFWVYIRAVQRSRWPALIVGASLILTASTTALVGYLCYLAIQMRSMRVNVVKLTLVTIALVVLGIVFKDQVAQLWADMVANKLSGSNTSGQERSAGFVASIDFWSHAPVANQLVGIGFGYIRSTDMFSTLLVNSGLLGMLLFSLLLLYPALKLDWAPKAMALRQCCVATFVMMMVSVPEFSYLAPWTFVALAYCRLYHRKLALRRTSEMTVQNRTWA